MSLHGLNNRPGRWQGQGEGRIRHFCHLLINFYNTKYRSSLSCYSQPAEWLCGHCVIGLGHLQSPQWGSVLERRDERRGLHPAYTVKCDDNSLCFVNHHYRVITTDTNTARPGGDRNTSYSGEKVEEILNWVSGVSGVVNIKVKHRDDQLYNFLISQPGGSLVSSTTTRQMNETYWSEVPRLD